MHPKFPIFCRVLFITESELNINRWKSYSIYYWSFSSSGKQITLKRDEGALLNVDRRSCCKLSLDSVRVEKKNDMQVTLVRGTIIFSWFLIKLYSCCQACTRECSKKVIEDCVKYAEKCTRTKRVWWAAICQQQSTMKKKYKINL